MRAAVPIGVVCTGLVLGAGAAWLWDGHAHPSAGPPARSGHAPVGHRKAQQPDRSDAQLRQTRTALAAAQATVRTLQARLRRATQTARQLREQLAAQPPWLTALLNQLTRPPGNSHSPWFGSEAG